MKIVVDYRADGRVDYVKALPDSRNGRWYNGPEMTSNPAEALKMRPRTAARVANLISTGKVQEVA